MHVVRLNPKPVSEGAEKLKAAALKLFAERGVDGVTVREIAAASGQKNHAAVSYHFGSKEALIRELIIEGARVINDRRWKALNAIEARDSPATLQEIVDLLIYPGVSVRQDQDEECYNRFVVLLGMSHRDFFMDVLGGEYNSGYQRCLDHLRRFMTHLSEAMVTQRLLFIGAYLGAVLSARESLLADQSRPHPTWQAEETLKHFASTVKAIITAPAETD